MMNRNKYFADKRDSSPVGGGAGDTWIIFVVVRLLFFQNKIVDQEALTVHIKEISFSKQATFHDRCSPTFHFYVVWCASNAMHNSLGNT